MTTAIAIQLKSNYASAMTTARQDAALGKIPVYAIRLVKESVAEYGDIIKKKIRCPEDAADILYKFYEELDRETFVVMLLSTKNHVMGINVASVGTLNATLVDIRNVFKPAIVAGAASIIVAHNHPSGDPTPGKDDIGITKRLMDAGQLLDIPVTDHLVIGEGRYISMKKQGIA